jgi:hypothetical protein
VTRKPHVRFGRPAVVVEKVLAFDRGEVDTGHGRSNWNGGGGYGMAGYYISTIDGEVFSQLTTSPTREQGLVLADYLRQWLGELDEDDGGRPPPWPDDPKGQANWVTERLARLDWYSDLSYEEATTWDEVVASLRGEPGEIFGIDHQLYDYEGIYWDCAEIAARQGATMMADPTFGGSAFRYFGRPAAPRYTVYPMYSLFTPEQARRLLAQLEGVEPHFRALTGGAGSPREQFFEGLLPPVRDAVARGRVLWVLTDT